MEAVIPFPPVPASPAAPISAPCRRRRAAPPRLGPPSSLHTPRSPPSGAAYWCADAAPGHGPARRGRAPGFAPRPAGPRTGPQTLRPVTARQADRGADRGAQRPGHAGPGPDAFDGHQAPVIVVFLVVAAYADAVIEAPVAPF